MILQQPKWYKKEIIEKNWVILKWIPYTKIEN